MVRMPLLLAVVALTAACDPAMSASGIDAQVIDVTTSDSTALGGDATATSSELSGEWVLVTDWSTCVAVGDTIELRNYELSKVTIVQDGAELRETREDCSVVNTPLLGMVTVIPTVAVNSANPMHSSAFAPVVAPGAPYIGGVESQLWGLKMVDPVSETMPTDANDPRIYDADKDSHPGVTLQVGGVCQLYAINRAVMQRVGKFNADGSISGEGARSLVQVPLGATQGFCAQPFASYSNQTGNHWKMLRVDSKGLHLDQDGDGSVSCAEIMQSQAAFTSWVEPNDANCSTAKP